MFKLILLLTINTGDHRFVLDSHLTKAQCEAQRAQLENTGQKTEHVRIANTYTCEAVSGVLNRR